MSNLLANLWQRLAGSDDDCLRGIYSKPLPLISHHEEFPQVPAPEGASSLTFLAVQWVSGEIYPEDMPSRAADLLEAGYDSPTLRRLAGETDIRVSADAEPLVAKMFLELSVAYPLSEKSAKLTNSREIAREVIAGLRSPWDAASKIGVIWRWDSKVDAVEEINFILDEIDWEKQYRRSNEELEQVIIQAFVRLAMIDVP